MSVTHSKRQMPSYWPLYDRSQFAPATRVPLLFEIGMKRSKVSALRAIQGVITTSIASTPNPTDVQRALHVGPPRRNASGRSTNGTSNRPSVRVERGQTGERAGDHPVEPVRFVERPVDAEQEAGHEHGVEALGHQRRVDLEQHGVHGRQARGDEPDRWPPHPSTGQADEHDRGRPDERGEHLLCVHRVAPGHVDHGEGGREERREFGRGGAGQLTLGSDVAVAVGQPGREEVVGLGVSGEDDVVGDGERVDEPHRQREQRHGQEKPGEPTSRAGRSRGWRGIGDDPFGGLHSGRSVVRRRAVSRQYDHSP